MVRRLVLQQACKLCSAVRTLNYDAGESFIDFLSNAFAGFAELTHAFSGLALLTGDTGH